MTLDTLPSELLDSGRFGRIDDAARAALVNDTDFLLFLEHTDDAVEAMTDGEESSAFIWCNEREGATRDDAIAVAREAERRMGLVKR